MHQGVYDQQIVRIRDVVYRVVAIPGTANTWNQPNFPFAGEPSNDSAPLEVIATALDIGRVAMCRVRNFPNIDKAFERFFIQCKAR
ncbi:hypothetical protein [Xanthomonas fragariae]|uniref:hypothetical protein n=1 Tax=Xanthomonas fragariae TaxID=48664 RepID=UPI001ABE36E0|nr:hypothetical protein [Xanthomonas fragariae]UKR51666.1 hypothetical protein K4A87_12775 [Xanthomonas fragariae]